jgi:hypothetical protein
LVAKAIVVRGRVIRLEENKHAEIFTLVLKGTVEESWYNSSSDGNNFIEISQEELIGILNNEEFVKKEKVAVADDGLLFRL